MVFNGFYSIFVPFAHWGAYVVHTPQKFNCSLFCLSNVSKYIVNIKDAISAISALSAAILPHFPHPVRHKKAVGGLPRSECSMGPKMAQKSELRIIWSFNFYYINLVFLIFRICSIMSQLQFIYKTLHFHVGYKMVKNLTSRNLPHFFFREKNWSGNSGKKSGYQILIFLVRFWDWTV